MKFGELIPYNQTFRKACSKDVHSCFLPKKPPKTGTPEFTDSRRRHHVKILQQCHFLPEKVSGLIRSKKRATTRLHSKLTVLSMLHATIISTKNVHHGPYPLKTNATTPNNSAIREAFKYSIVHFCVPLHISAKLAVICIVSVQYHSDVVLVSLAFPFKGRAQKKRRLSFL